MKYIKLFENFENEQSEKDNKFNYMLLNRWQSDCEYFLGYGCGSENILPSKSVEEHILNMKELWKKLPVKPEWLSYEQIEQYEKDMLENREKKLNLKK